MRIRYEDALSNRGELELAEVRSGDAVRFDAAFVKHGDDRLEVTRGELGKVLDVYPDSGELLIDVTATLRSGETARTEVTSLVVPAGDVQLLVDALDSRLPSTRAARYAKTTPRDWLALIVWALQAMRDEYSGERGLTIQSPRHVVWALERMAQDIRQRLPRHEIDYEDDDVNSAAVAGEMESLAGMVGDLSAAEWREQLPSLAEISDKSLLAEVERLAPQPAPKVVVVSPDDLETEAQRAEETARQRRWDDFLEARHAPITPPTFEEAPPAVRSPLALEESPNPLRMPPMISERPRHDVSMIDGDWAADAPHDWTESPAIRVPIRVGDGLAAQTRNQRVWAALGMPVRHRRTNAYGDVVAVEPPDAVYVNLVDRGSGLPQHREPERWSALDTILAEEWPDAQAVTPEALALWRRQRRRGVYDVLVSAADVPC